MLTKQHLSPPGVPVIPTVEALFTILGVNIGDTTLTAVTEAAMVLALIVTGLHVTFLSLNSHPA